MSLRSGSARGRLAEPRDDRLQITALPSLRRTFHVPGRGTVGVTLEPIRRADGSPVFIIEWWVKPERLTLQDIAVFDRGLAEARRELLADMEALHAST